MAEGTGKKQRGRGRPFPPGVSGNPGGRPRGSISIMGKLKQMWAEHPEDLDAFVMEIRKDKMMRREIVQQIDGKPVQPIANADGTPFVMKVINYNGDNDSVQLPPEELSA